MGSHGSLAVGATLAQAVDHAVLLEWLCALHHRASALGPVRPLTTEEQTAVVQAVLDRGYGSTSPSSAVPTTGQSRKEHA